MSKHRRRRLRRTRDQRLISRVVAALGTPRPQPVYEVRHSMGGWAIKFSRPHGPWDAGETISFTQPKGVR